MKTKSLFVLAAVAAVSLSACNTVNGAGKDLKSAGGAVSDVSGQNAKKR
ncbi:MULTISPECIES: entericidin A/B family lipoprotein [unclassified Sphingomonas]|nr:MULTISPECIES: entericidin A/B family lipoprotein [unclassified Sphingomonas]